MRIGKALAVLMIVVLFLGVLGIAQDGEHTASFEIGATGVASDGFEAGELELTTPLSWSGNSNLVSPTYRGTVDSNPAVWTITCNRDLAIHVIATIPTGTGSIANRTMKADFRVMFYADAGSDSGVIINDWAGVSNHAPSNTFESEPVSLWAYELGEASEIVLEARAERKGVADKAGVYEMTLALMVSSGSL